MPYANWSGIAGGSGGGASSFSGLTGTCAQSQIAPFDPTTAGNWYTGYFDDFMEYQNGVDTGNFPYWAITNGTGAIGRSQPTSSDTNRNGIIAMSGGSASTGYSLAMISVQNIFLGNCAYSFSTSLQMATVGINGTNDYTSRVGFIDNWPTTNNCIYLTVDFSLASDHNWKLVTKKGGTATVADTGIAADTSWHNMRVEINNAGTSVTAFIDGVSVATSSTNIPNNTVIGPAIQHAWVSGTLINIKHDWMYLKYNLGGVRGTF